MEGRAPRIFTFARLGLLTLGATLGALAFPLAFPLGSREELFPSGMLEPLAFVCLVPVLVAVRSLGPVRALGAGFLAGTIFFTEVFWWLDVAMTTFAPLNHVTAVPLIVALAGWCAFHWGLAFGLARYFEDRHRWPMGLTLGPLWMASELLRNYLFSGFPWANLGYSQARNLYLSQVASLGGVYGLALLVAWVNGALYELLRHVFWSERKFPSIQVYVSAAALTFGHAYGAWRVAKVDPEIQAAPKIRIGVVQGNIDQKLKNLQGSYRDMILDAYNPATEAVDNEDVDLIVWPEAAFPAMFRKGTQSIRGAGLSKERYSARLLIGVDVRDPKDLRKGNENAAFLVGEDLRVEDRYTKYHLVPFGEYVLWNLDELLPIGNLVPGTFRPGTELRPLSVPLRGPRDQGVGRAAKLGVMICFDAIFPEISRTYANAGADVLVNLTNDAWYGFSSAPYQFLRMVAVRAIETGRPVARAANTGISAFIDPLGRVTQATPIGVVDADGSEVDARLRLPSVWRTAELPLLSEKTVYGAIGDAPAYAASVFAVFGWGLGLWRGRRREGRGSRDG